MRQLAVVEPAVAKDRLFEVLAAVEVMALQDVLDPAIEAFDHAIGLRMHRRGQAMLDTERVAEAVEVVFARGGALPQAEEPVRELLAITPSER